MRAATHLELSQRSTHRAARLLTLTRSAIRYGDPIAAAIGARLCCRSARAGYFHLRACIVLTAHIELTRIDSPEMN